MYAPAMPSSVSVSRESLWTAANRYGYTTLVTSKKDVIGIGVPLKSCDESRSQPAGSAALSFVPPVFGGSGREPQGSPVSARVSRYANLFEPPPPIGVGCVGFSKPKLLEAIHG